MKALHISYILFTIIISSSTSCKKDFLEAKPKSTIVVPTTIEDLKALLANVTVFASKSPVIEFLSSDEFYYSDYAAWQGTLSPVERYSYIWADDPYGGGPTVLDWNGAFEGIYYCNVILKALEDIPVTNDNRNKVYDIKSAAYFYRAFNYHLLTEIFSLPVSIGGSLGLPLRSSPDVDDLKQRSSINETHDYILNDIQSALNYSVDSVPTPLRHIPCKASIYALMARVKLNSGDYMAAEKYSDSCLKLYDKLIDFNTLSQTSANPFPFINDEAIFRTVSNIYLSVVSSTSVTTVIIDSNLIKSYDKEDLRLKIFYRDGISTSKLIKCGLGGTGTQPFTGIGMDEVYLIKSESAARNGNIPNSLKYLNALLKTRYLPGYINYTTTDKETLIEKVLTERRKELVFRGIRWQDLRRLTFIENKNISIKKVVNSVEYTLPPKSLRYAFPIPQDEINYSKISQNPR